MLFSYVRRDRSMYGTIETDAQLTSYKTYPKDSQSSQCTLQDRYTTHCIPSRPTCSQDASMRVLNIVVLNRMRYARVNRRAGWDVTTLVCVARVDGYAAVYTTWMFEPRDDGREPDREEETDRWWCRLTTMMTVIFGLNCFSWQAAGWSMACGERWGEGMIWG